MELIKGPRYIRAMRKMGMWGVKEVRGPRQVYGELAGGRLNCVFASLSN